MVSSKYKFSDDVFIELVKSSFSIREVCTKLGIAGSGGSYRTFHLRTERLKLDISHFTGQGYLKGKTHNWGKSIPLEEILIENSKKVLGHSLKKRIIKYGLLINECDECKLKNIWNNKPIVLQIDHINGNHFDHRLENLRLLCPNCHSQTLTFCSKNSRIIGPIYKKELVGKATVIPIIKELKKCSICSSEVKDYRAKYCVKCYRDHRSELQSHYVRKTKIEWPSVNELLERLKTTSYLQLGHELGISDNAIRKHLKYHKQKI